MDNSIGLTQLKDAARVIGRYLYDAGQPVKHTTLLEALSVGLGARNLRTLRAQLQGPSDTSAPKGTTLPDIADRTIPLYLEVNPDDGISECPGYFKAFITREWLALLQTWMGRMRHAQSQAVREGHNIGYLTTTLPSCLDGGFDHTPCDQEVVDTLWRLCPEGSFYFWGYGDEGSSFSTVPCGLPELAQKIAWVLQDKAQEVVFGDPRLDEDASHDGRRFESDQHP